MHIIIIINIQWRSQKFQLGEGLVSLFPSPSPFVPPHSTLPFLPMPSFPVLPFSPPFPSLKSRTPKIQLEGLGSAKSSLSGVWGGAPAEIEFNAF